MDSFTSRVRPYLDVDVPATAANFEEAGYLAANPDVAEVVQGSLANRWASGRAHFDAIGHAEKRLVRQLTALSACRAGKVARLRPHVRADASCTERGGKMYCAEHGIRTDHPPSSNYYDDYVMQAINETPDGLVLDCGAGFRPRYFDNVVNYEIADYDTTDVVGSGDDLPFCDNTFDAVISVAVLEHVKDPFKCASELLRVLRPGGKIVCAAPFLVPYHGYPSHYYNMTEQGLRALFGNKITVEFHEVIDSLLPVWTLTWIVESWAAGLPAPAREAFLDMPLRELLKKPAQLLNEPWVRGLSREKNFELAAGTMLIGRKAT
jgi:SAM-dependent methyltransferase